MSYVLNNVSTADRFTSATTLACPGARRVLLYVRNAAIAYQLGEGQPASSWGEERFLPPGTLTRALTFDAIRVRSWVAGVPAQVSIDVPGPGEL